ncbi:MAG: DNA-3-methyladenine glycosylase [Bryobacteraceae bacterium]
MIRSKVLLSMTDPGMADLRLPDLLAESEILPENFYFASTIKVARRLLGKVLCHDGAAGMIVETEAYLGGDDLAAHSSRGITDRTRVIFGPPGRAYVYFIYGMWECLNIVAEPNGQPGCVLIRALQPLAGIELMRQRRPADARIEKLASGPGRLTRALSITRSLNGADLRKGPLFAYRWRREPKFRITTTARIGINKCADWPLRFYIAGNRFVSRP